MFSQNAYSQFGSNYSPNSGQTFGQNPIASNPEDGMSGDRSQQTPALQSLQQYSNPANPNSQQTAQQPAQSPQVNSAPSAGGSSTSASNAPGMSWSQMQSNGIARPPYPSPSASVDPSQITSPSPTLGTLTPTTSSTGVAQPDLGATLANAYQNYQGIGQFQNPNSQVTTSGGNTFTTPSPLAQSTNAAAQNLLNQPNPYLSQAYQSQLAQTMGSIDDQYATADQQLQANLASRGLDSAGTIGATDLRYNNLLQRSAKTDAATNLLDQLASTYGADQTNAINTAQGVTGQNYNQALGTYGANAASQAQNFGQQNTALSNLLGYGQQSFNNQVTTSTLNNNQNNTQAQLLLQLLGAGYTA